MLTRISRTLVVVLLVAPTGAAGAASYISDELSVIMRRGPGTGYKIIDNAVAGARVQVLKRNDIWTEVRTSDGSQGWVLTSMLAAQPAARDQIPALRTKLDEFEQANAALKQELAQAADGNSELAQTRTELTAEKQRLLSELTEIKRVSADAIRISAENQKFRQRIIEMETEIARLRSDNAALRSWYGGMKVGAVILVAGLALGLVLPMAWRRARKDRNSF